MVEYINKQVEALEQQISTLDQTSSTYYFLCGKISGYKDALEAFDVFK